MDNKMLRRPKRDTDIVEYISNKKQKYTTEDSMVDEQENTTPNFTDPILSNISLNSVKNKEENSEGVKHLSSTPED